LQKPYEIKNGLLYLPNVPGLGLEWNEEIISANRIDL
jgi:mandelate racemase